jgi:LacI family transcriptional regulator
VFAANNMLAQGVFEAVRSRGLRVPADLSIVAFDDVPWMSMVSPAITTVDQHTDELGHTCAQLVLERVAGSAGERPSAARAAAIRYVEPSVVVRDSSGPPPGAGRAG